MKRSIGLWYQVMINCLAIWWMCQGYTLQEDHVWWPARAKRHGKVFPWKWVSGETPLDILKCLICTSCLVNNMSEMVWVMSVRHVWMWNIKRRLGWLTEGLLTQERSLHSSLTMAYCDDKWISVLWPLLRICMLNCGSLVSSTTMPIILLCLLIITWIPTYHASSWHNLIQANSDQ